MYGSTIFNTKLSAIISVISGIGFIAVLAFTPINTKKKKGNFLHDEEDLPLKNPSGKVYASNKTGKKEESLISIKAFKKLQENVYKSIWGSSFSNPQLEDRMTPFFNDNQIRPYQNLQPDVFTYYKDEKLSMSSVGDTRTIPNQILEYKYQNKIADTTSLLQSRNSQIRNLEMSYHLNSNFSANFKSTQYDIFDDRLKQYPTTMAGISFNSKYISTGFIAGESSLNNPYRYSQGNFMSGNNYYRDTDMQFRDVDRLNKNLFELQANISPTKNLMFQTAVFNSNRSLINETNVSEGARIAMAIGLKYIVLNIKYNYLSDNLMRSLMRPDSSTTMFNKDYAAFGFTFFIDKNKQYSLYIGNNVYNITTMTRPTDSSSTVPVNNSFSASFRGRNSDFNTTFFFNFKNNANREFYYSNFGVFRLPISSQLNFDYATSMGLELSF